MTRYSHTAGQAFSVAVGAREPPGQRPAVAGMPGSGPPGPQSPRGWRTRLQTPRSRGPPERIRCKAQPETEGIETRGSGVRGAASLVLQSPARNRGHRNNSASATYSFLPLALQSPARNRGHRNPLGPGPSNLSRLSLQSPARNRGHRNMKSISISAQKASGCKAQPETEGIETNIPSSLTTG